MNREALITEINGKKMIEICKVINRLKKRVNSMQIARNVLAKQNAPKMIGIWPAIGARFEYIKNRGSRVSCLRPRAVWAILSFILTNDITNKRRSHYESGARRLF